MAELRCSHCDALIQRQNKGYKRKSLLTVVDLKSAHRLFPHLDPHRAFICFSCVTHVYRVTKKSGKRRTYVDPNPPSRPAAPGAPVPSDPGQPVLSVSSVPPSPKRRKKRRRPPLNEHDYASQDPPSSARSEPPPVRRVHRGGLMSQRKVLVNDLDGPFRRTFSPDSLSDFSWDQTTSWAEQKAPLTVSCLRSMFPAASKIQRQMVNYSGGNKPRRLTESEVKQLLERRICLVLSVSLYTSSLRACFLQTAFGVEMLRHRCPIRIFSIMNGLGLSQSKTTARIHAKRLAEEHERQVKSWRDEIQTARRTQFCSDDSKKAAAFTFSWGKVRVPSVCRSDSTERRFSSVTWAFRFAHKVRVNFRYLHGPPINAVEVSAYRILPSNQTYESLRQRMKTLVMRIIADHLTALKGPRDRVLRHVPHTYSHLMKEQSTTVSLGAVIPDSSGESVSAALGLTDYVPEVCGTPYHLLYCGDVPNTDRTETQNHQTPDLNPDLNPDLRSNLRSGGLIEAPPEFQKEHLLHEDMMKMLLSEKSANARGTLRHILSLFHFKTFNNSAKDSFINLWDFITTSRLIST